MVQIKVRFNGVKVVPLLGRKIHDVEDYKHGRMYRLYDRDQAQLL